MRLCTKKIACIILSISMALTSSNMTTYTSAATIKKNILTNDTTLKTESGEDEELLEETTDETMDEDKEETKKKQEYLKKLKLNWDLKPNKTVTYTAPFAAVGKKKVQGKITNYKISDANKKGYKKLTFTYIVKNLYKPTAEEVHKMVNSSYCRRTGSLSSGTYFAVLDYYTGLALESDNDMDVTVRSGKWKAVNVKKYKDKDGCRVSLNSTKVKVTVVYPTDYDGLCIAIGGDNVLNLSKADTSFWKGKTVFGKTTYYKKGKKNSHFMRVTK